MKKKNTIINFNLTLNEFDSIFNDTKKIDVNQIKIYDIKKFELSTNIKWMKYGSYKSKNFFPKTNYDINELSGEIKKTNIKCWNCCYNFISKPIGLPYKTKISKLTNQKIFYVKGCFCSFSCAKTYNINTSNMVSWCSYEKLLNEYYLLSGGILPIQKASNKEVLLDFGGTISIDKFREAFNKNKIYKMKLPPTISLNHSIHKEYNNIFNNIKKKSTPDLFSQIKIKKKKL